MTKTDFDIVIVGAGAVGLAFAAAMRSSGYSMLILESGLTPTFDDTRFDLRVNTLNLASETFLNAIGAWPKMKAKRVATFDRIKVWDSAGGRIQFQGDEIGEPHLGHVVESSVLTTSIKEIVDQDNAVNLRTQVKLASVTEDDAVRLQLTDGECLSCQLLVGADGGQSTVRQSVGINWSESAYDQLALVAEIEVSEPQHATALQTFLPTGPLAFLPLANGNYSIVFSAEKSFAEHLLTLPAVQFERKLAESMDYQLGETRLVSRIVSFELRKLEAATYLAGRTVLAGDAAHIIHPLAGMGVNLGLMDAAGLSEVLLEAAPDSRSDPMQYAKLRKYERWRKSSNMPIGWAMDGFHHGFGHPWKPIQGILGMGLSLTNRLAFAKHEMIRLACGLRGDLPTLARRA